MKVLGSHMGEHLQTQVKAKYIWRFTGDNHPKWAQEARRPDGCADPVQFADDADWLAHTYFEVTKQGELSRRSTYCESHPTWPNNPELRESAQ